MLRKKTRISLLSPITWAFSLRFFASVVSFRSMSNVLSLFFRLIFVWLRWFCSTNSHPTPTSPLTSIIMRTDAFTSFDSYVEVTWSCSLLTHRRRCFLFAFALSLFLSLANESSVGLAKSSVVQCGSVEARRSAQGSKWATAKSQLYLYGGLTVCLYGCGHLLGIKQRHACRYWRRKS